MQNLYGGLIVANKNLNTQLGNEIANTYLGLASGVGNVAQAAAWQSMAAWMMYLNYQGKWDASPDMVTKLADNMIQMAIQYGVACCHHTCKNLDFNMKLIQSSSLSSADKAKYSQILAQATLTDPLYKDDSSSDSSNPDDSNGDTSDTDDNNNDQVLVNGTTNNDQSGSGEAGGATAAGLDTSVDPADAKLHHLNLKMLLHNQIHLKVNLELLLMKFLKVLHLNLQLVNQVLLLYLLLQ